MKKKYLFAVPAALIIALGAYILGSGKLYSYFEKDVVLVEADTNCNLHTDVCKVIFGDGKSIKLDISKPILAGQALEFSVETSGLEEKKLLVKIYGVNMNMGLFEYPLSKANDGEYRGSGLLPTCMSGKMTWKVNIISEKSALGASYILEI